LMLEKRLHRGKDLRSNLSCGVIIQVNHSPQNPPRDR
jgi:hypothetical protein